MVKYFVKYNNEGLITEYAPKVKGSVLNYNSETNMANLLADGYEYVEVDNGYVKGMRPISSVKDEAYVQINNTTTTTVSKIKAGVTNDEVATWATQEKEARDWYNDNSVSTPLCDSIASARGMVKDEFMEKVLAKSDAYALYVGRALGLNQKYTEKVEEATTVEEIEVLLNELNIELYEIEE